MLDLSVVCVLSVFTWITYISTRILNRLDRDAKLNRRIRRRADHFNTKMDQQNIQARAEFIRLLRKVYTWIDTRCSSKLAQHVKGRDFLEKMGCIRPGNASVFSTSVPMPEPPVMRPDHMSSESSLNLAS